MFLKRLLTELMSKSGRIKKKKEKEETLITEAMTGAFLRQELNWKLG